MSTVKKIFQDSVAQFRQPRTLAVAAMLIALNITMDALNIRVQITPQLRIGFGFLTIAMTGMLFGPAVAMASGAASDILGWLLNNGGGAYFPGFTITAILAGMIWGLALYRQPLRWYRVLAAKLSINIFLNILLNSFWLYLYYGQAFQLTTLPLRIGKNLIMLPVEIILTLFVGNIVLRAVRRTSMVSSDSVHR